MEKSYDNLTSEDFQQFPIWIPVDDFEDENFGVLSYEGDVLDFEEIYIISAWIKLADGSILDGYVRYSSGTPIVMGLFLPNHPTLELLVEPFAEPESTYRELANELNKQEDDVFPVESITKVKLALKNKVC